MVRTTSAVLGLVGAAAGGAAAWTVYRNRTTPHVPYDVVEPGEVELRRYPRAVVAETDASTEWEAFGRLFRYASGLNRASARDPTTAPVETDDLRAPGERLPVTAPVETGASRSEGDESERGDVRMALYLPERYDAATAPEPVDPAVRVVDVPPRTLAVRRFTRRATDRRVARETDRLRSALDARPGLTPAGEPFVLRYGTPWSLPFRRRTEVAVELADD